jgi:hypothetical protein
MPFTYTEHQLPTKPTPGHPTNPGALFFSCICTLHELALIAPHPSVVKLYDNI